MCYNRVIIFDNLGCLQRLNDIYFVIRFPLQIRYFYFFLYTTASTSEIMIHNSCVFYLLPSALSIDHFFIENMRKRNK